MRGAAAVRVTAASSLAVLLTAPSLDSGYLPVFPGYARPWLAKWPAYGSLIRWHNDDAFGFWRVDLVDPFNPAGYFDVGRFALGRLFQPPVNFDVGGMPLGHDTRDVQVVGPYGDTFTDRREGSARRRIQVQITALDRIEVEEGISEVQRLAGMWGDVFVHLDPGSTGIRYQKYFMQGVFTTPQVHQHIAVYNENGDMFGANLTLREI